MSEITEEIPTLKETATQREKTIGDLLHEKSELKERIETDFATIKNLTEELEHYKIHDEDLIKLVTTHQLVSIEEYQKQTKIINEIDLIIDDYECANNGLEELPDLIKAILKQ